MGQSVDYRLDDRYGAKAGKLDSIQKGQSLRPSKTNARLSRDHSVVSDKTQQINKAEGTGAQDEADFFQEEGGKSDKASKHTIERYKLELARRLQGSPTKRERFASDSELQQDNQITSNEQPNRLDQKFRVENV